MEKEEIILKEISMCQTFVSGVCQNPFYNTPNPELEWNNQVIMVDPKKLAKFLAKFIKIEPKDLIN